MPERFTAAFAKRLNALAQVEVREAAAGDLITSALMLISPEGHHLLVPRGGNRHFAEIKGGPLSSAASILPLHQTGPALLSFAGIKQGVSA